MHAELMAVDLRWDQLSLRRFIHFKWLKFSLQHLTRPEHDAQTESWPTESTPCNTNHVFINPHPTSETIANNCKPSFYLKLLQITSFPTHLINHFKHILPLYPLARLQTPEIAGSLRRPFLTETTSLLVTLQRITCRSAVFCFRSTVVVCLVKARSWRESQEGRDGRDGRFQWVKYGEMCKCVLVYLKNEAGFQRL